MGLVSWEMGVKCDRLDGRMMMSGCGVVLDEKVSGLESVGLMD